VAIIVQLEAELVHDGDRPGETDEHPATGDASAPILEA